MLRGAATANLLSQRTKNWANISKTTILLSSPNRTPLPTSSKMSRSKDSLLSNTTPRDLRGKRLNLRNLIISNLLLIKCRKWKENLVTFCSSFGLLKFWLKLFKRIKNFCKLKGEIYFLEKLSIMRAAEILMHLSNSSNPEVPKETKPLKMMKITTM